jgi:hypothetical protein
MLGQTATSKRTRHSGSAPPPSLTSHYSNPLQELETSVYLPACPIVYTRIPLITFARIARGDLALLTADSVKIFVMVLSPSSVAVGEKHSSAKILHVSAYQIRAPVVICSALLHRTVPYSITPSVNVTHRVA